MRIARRWGFAALGVTALTIAVYCLQRVGGVHEYWVRWFRIEDRKFGWPLDVLTGIGVCCGLLCLAAVGTSEQRGGLAVLLELLASRPARTLGRFSYSLYLINGPLLGALIGFVAAMHLRTTAAYAVWWAVAIPVGMLGGYLFYLSVERQCISTNRRRRAASLVPTPLAVEAAAIAG
jgi:peptidoglycan/LPS O-acetylase OafA/YrhL